MIRCVISDLDGTLVDSFEANFQAYFKAFQETGKVLTRDTYKQCFGLGFSDFICRFKLSKAEELKIHELKRKYYPNYFRLITINKNLLEILEAFRDTGIKVALASTASKNNFLALCNHFKLQNHFDFFLTGDDILKSKPDPEIYIKVMKHFNVVARESLIFEDSDIGLEAARRSGAKTVVDVRRWRNLE